MKDIKTILHMLFALMLHAASISCLIMGLIVKDTYVLAMAIFLYLMAFRHESEDKR